MSGTMLLRSRCEPDARADYFVDSIDQLKNNLQGQSTCLNFGTQCVSESEEIQFLLRSSIISCQRQIFGIVASEYKLICGLLYRSSEHTPIASRTEDPPLKTAST